MKALSASGLQASSSLKQICNALEGTWPLVIGQCGDLVALAASATVQFPM